MASIQSITPLHNHPILLGHRGASKYARENTFAAFDLALEHGCDGFEFDVRYTRDARCVVSHDASYRRRQIEKRSFEELGLPCAEQAIGTYAKRAFLDIELKTPGEAPLILDAISATGSDRWIISSFLPGVLKAVNSEYPKAPLGLICESAQQLRLWPTLPITAVMIRHTLASDAVMVKLQSAGKQVFVWTVNRETQMRRFAELGAAGLISDDTQLLSRTFGRLNR